MPNRIFRSGRGNARTVSLPVSGGLLPGTAVYVGATSLAPAFSASGGHLALLGDRDFYSDPSLSFSATDPLRTPYAPGDTGIAYMLQPDQEYLWAMAAGNYLSGQELTVGALGRLTAATSGSVVVAYFDRPSGGVGAGDLVDVVIANSYTKA